MPLRPEFEFTTERTPASEALRAFLEAICSAEGPTAEAEAKVDIRTNLYSESLTCTKLNDDRTLPDNAARVVERVSDDLYEQVEQLQATWTRISGNQTVTATVTPHPDFFAYKVHVKEGVANSESHRGVLDALRRSFKPYDVPLSRFSGLPEELREFHRAQEEVFARRETRLLEGTQQLQKAILDAERNAQRQIQKARDATQEREKELDELHDERARDLEEREEAFRKKQEEFDDHARTHARRKNQESFEAVLERHREFRVSKASSRKRWPIHVASVAGLLAGIALYIYAIERHKGPDLYTALPATLLFGSTLTFYLLWLRRWSDSHALAEVNARAFEEDFSRAYWLAELMFEWAELDGNKELPPEVVEALSRGLFSVQREGALGDEHPISSLIARVPNLRKLTMDRRSVSLETDARDARPQRKHQ